MALVGQLGSGKTTFARGLVCGLECPHYGKVSSPTYVLEQVYEGRLAIHHYDAYRLKGGEELQALGFDEHLGTRRVLIVEWADRVMSHLPADRLQVELRFANPTVPEIRHIRIFGLSSRWADVLKLLEKNE